MRSFGIPWCAGAAFLVLGIVLTGLRAEEADKEEKEDHPNPIYKHWSSFKVGASVTRREKVKFPADSEEGQRYHEHTLVKDTITKLVDLTPEKATVEVVELEHGRGYLQESAPFKLIYFAHIRKGLGTPKTGFDKHKQEDVDVEVRGKKYKATLVETTYKSGPVVHTQKIWLSDEIPGGILKEEKVEKKGDEILTESTLEVVRFKEKAD